MQPIFYVGTLSLTGKIVIAAITIAALILFIRNWRNWRK